MRRCCQTVCGGLSSNFNCYTDIEDKTVQSFQLDNISIHHHGDYSGAFEVTFPTDVAGCYHGRATLSPQQALDFASGEDEFLTLKDKFSDQVCRLPRSGVRELLGWAYFGKLESAIIRDLEAKSDRLQDDENGFERFYLDHKDQFTVEVSPGDYGGPSIEMTVTESIKRKLLE